MRYSKSCRRRYEAADLNTYQNRVSGGGRKNVRNKVLARSRNLCFSSLNKSLTGPWDRNNFSYREGDMASFVNQVSWRAGTVGPVPFTPSGIRGDWQTFHVP